MNEFLTKQLQLDQETINAYIRIGNISNGKVNVSALIGNLAATEFYTSQFQQAVMEIQSGQVQQITLGEQGGKQVNITASTLSMDDTMLYTLATANEEYGVGSVALFVKSPKQPPKGHHNSMIDVTEGHTDQFSDNVASFLTNLFGINGPINVPGYGPVSAQQWVNGAVQFGGIVSVISMGAAAAANYTGLGIAAAAGAGFLVPTVAALGLGYFLYNGYQQILGSSMSSYYNEYTSDSNLYSYDPNAGPAGDYYSYSQPTSYGNDLTNYYSDLVASYNDVYGDSSQDVASEIDDDYSSIYDGLTD